MIDRVAIAHDFYTNMEEPSQELCDLAYTLFDRYGHLKTEYKEHPIKKGTDIWGKELDRGRILYIVNLSSEKQNRRQGFARKLILAMLDRARKEHHRFYAIVAPGFLTAEVDRERRETSDDIEVTQLRLEEIATSFWRSVGFRRIGSSKYFALAGFRDHPYHMLATTDDYDPPESVDAIESPSEILQRQLDKRRTTMEVGFATIHNADNFLGYSDALVAQLAALGGVSNPTRIQKLRFRYGCTCGQCTEGFLSPRMRFSLCQQMDAALRDELAIEYGTMQRVPPSIKAKIKSNKGIRNSYLDLFKAFRAMLKVADVLPTEQNLLAKFTPKTQEQLFMERGGTVFSLGSSIFHLAMTWDDNAMCRDPVRDRFEEDENEEEFHLHQPPEREALPERRNDLEYGFVSRMCGYEQVSPPSYLRDSDNGGNGGCAPQ
jgi:ribosomal protein S18 acetylase RimI-like enzyme